MSIAALLPGLSHRFTRIILGLCDELKAHSGENRPAQPLIHVVLMALRRRMERFNLLDAVRGRHAAGAACRTSPRGAACRSASPALACLPSPLNKEWAAAVAAVRLPTKQAWLLRMVQGTADKYWWLRDLMADPEMAKLLAASPEAGRLLRPLWRMIGAHPMPDILRLPRRPRSPPPVASPAPDPACASAVSARPGQPFAQAPRAGRKRMGFHRPRPGAFFAGVSLPERSYVYFVTIVQRIECSV